MLAFRIRLALYKLSMDTQQGKPVPARGLTPRDFFALRISGALMQDAHRSTGIAYSTIHGLANGANSSEETLTALALWARANPAARAAGVFISLDAMVDAKAGASADRDAARDADPGEVAA
jgi:hypothetical protein